MRIVWASAAFLAGVGAAIVFGFAPGHALPTSAFLLFGSAASIASIALVVTRRRAAFALLSIVFLLGTWRGGDAIHIFEDIDRYSITSSQDSILPNSPLNRLRIEIADNLEPSSSVVESGLPSALLIGDRSGIIDEATRNFRSAGMAHLLAISGLHVSLLGGSAMAASVAVFGRRRAFYLLVPLVTVLAYAALAGFAPPITRAAIMFTVFILGRSMGRGSHTIAALALAALAMVAYSPEIIASLSFQLSFAAMLGIAVAAPVLEGFTEIAPSDNKRAKRSSATSRVRQFVLGSLAVSLASTVGTLPLIALHFDAVPIWGTVSTLLALPAIPLLIFSSIVFVLTSHLPITFFSEIVAALVNSLSTYVIWIAALFAHLPPKPIDAGAWATWMTVAYYGVLGSIVLSWPWTINLAKRITPVWTTKINRLDLVNPVSSHAPLVLATSLFIAGALTWGATLTKPDPKPYLSVQFLETTIGESILIETPNGNRMLIDGAGSNTQIAETLAGLIPLTDRNIDVVMLTHSDADHVGGLPEVLNRFRTGAIIHSGLSSSSEAFSSWIDAIENHDNVNIARSGSVIALDEGVYLEIISAGCLDTIGPCTDDNDASIVSRLRFGDVSFLLTGDIEKTTEAILVATHPNLRATVLKAPHHGSITSSTEALLDAVTPAVIVVAVGSENRYGHPHSDVMSRLNSAVGEERVFRTDQLGTLEFRSDGERLWMVR